MRSVVRPKHLLRMRIEGNYYRSSICSMSMTGGSGNHRLMPPVDAVEDADGEKQGTGEGTEIRDGMKDLHPAMNNEIRMTNDEGNPKPECGVIPHLVIPSNFVI